VLLGTDKLIWVCSEERGVAVTNGDHHGGDASDSNSYGGLCRRVYHGRSTAEFLKKLAI